ncbi:hypothetical protein DM02DRAFT_734681 [Periconia macrospinosa]|uniref:Uncharacterized protein n=1 Tax=Periconia macrospinosa TaxID=97972 RepID=A0A2V1CY62_9PLEO|nr:hypothetical protein DM02DRAFT_734681 [Periconia macrospinosa]
MLLQTRRKLQMQKGGALTPGQATDTLRKDPRPIYEIKDIIEDPAWKRKPMKSWDVGHCSIQLNKELENYEILQHSRRILRKRKRSATLDSDSEADSHAEEELTSDDDSLEQQRRAQVRLVRQIERHMRAGIERDREKWGRADVHEGYSIKKIFLEAC